MKGLNLIFLLCILVSTVVCVAIYGMYFDNLSETSLMQIAYGWVFFLVTGIAGFIFKNNPRRVLYAIISGAVALLLLVIFYATIFPSL